MKYSIYYKKKSLIKIIYYKLKEIFFSKNFISGPDMVVISIITSLKRYKIKFNINPSFKMLNKNVIVLNDHEILKKLISFKKFKKFKLFAGPNISILPTEYSKLLLSPSIDRVIVPSKWVKKLYLEVSKTLLNKIYVWPSPVDINKFTKQKRIIKEYDFLVYIKFFKDKSLLNKCILYLKKNYKIKIIYYGKYKINLFYSLLNKSKYSIFFSESESQGIMYFESWAANVPSLVYNKKKFFSKGLSTLADPCPYLDERYNGLGFENFNTFKRNIQKLFKQNKNPKKWLINKYNMKKQTIKLLSQFKY